MKIIYPLSFLAAAILGGGIFYYWYFFTPLPHPATGCPNFRQQEITVGQNKISIGIAATRDQRTKGLGGCPVLPPSHGLYFPISPPHISGVWMKGMLIPIDVVWINGSRVIALEPKLAPPSSDAALVDLPVFNPPSPVTAFLELPAGEISRLNIAVGDRVGPAEFDI